MNFTTGTITYQEDELPVVCYPFLAIMIYTVLSALHIWLGELG